MVSRSSVEAECRAMGTMTIELIWIKSFLVALSMFQTELMKLYCDNQAALHIIRNPVFYERTKHIEIDCHFVQERLVIGDLETNYLHLKQQLAGIFTKPVGME